jgi:hypothetical protein
VVGSRLVARTFYHNCRDKGRREGTDVLANTSFTRYSMSADVSTVELCMFFSLFYNYRLFLFNIVLEMRIL